ncbi:cytochrome c [Vibrio lentus]|nr:cytochrome c [Vibrio lentus]
MEEIQHTINKGLNNLMPAFDKQLSENEILALGAYIRHAGFRVTAKTREPRSSVC